MKSNRCIKKLIRKTELDTNSAADRKVLQDVLQAQSASRSQQAAHTHVAIAAFVPPAARLAAAAVFVFAVGYITARLFVPAPVDVEELKTSITASLKATMDEEMNQRWQAFVAVQTDQLKEDVSRRVRQDVSDLVVQAVAASQARTNQRLMDLVERIEAARMEERRRVAAAFEQIERNRREDRTQFGNGLLTLAVRTDQLLNPK